MRKYFSLTLDENTAEKVINYHKLKMKEFLGNKDATLPKIATTLKEILQAGIIHLKI